MDTFQPRIIQLNAAEQVGFSAGAHFVAGDKIRLFSNNLTISPTTVIGDLVESAFTGYSAGVFPTAPFWLYGLDTNQQGEAIASFLTSFNQTALTVSETAYGYYVTDTTGAIFKLAANFDTPLPFDRIGNSLMLKLGFYVELHATGDAEFTQGP